MGASDADPERRRLNFVATARDRFSFLNGFGFVEMESSPTIVRYRKDEIEINVYHGRRSYEIGFEIGRGGERYSISEIIRATAPEEAARYRNFAAATPQNVVEGLARLEDLVKRHGERALRGDREFFAMLAALRKTWLESYALDVLAEQLRPKAEDAFRSGDYGRAAELYEKIRPRLSAAELKKLAFAKERARL